MATLIAPTPIPATDCIGNSLTTINGNFNTLFADIQSLQNTLSFPALLTTNGYQILPSGLIMQWGSTAAYTNEGAQTITFPIPFTTNCFQVIASTTYPTNDNKVNAWIQVVSFTKSNVILRAQSDAATPTSSKPIYGSYFAIGC